VLADEGTLLAERLDRAVEDDGVVGSSRRPLLA
jgi:hypothetical protein